MAEDDCPAMGVGFDPDDASCQDCEKNYGEDYERCEILTIASKADDEPEDEVAEPGFDTHEAVLPDEPEDEPDDVLDVEPDDAEIELPDPAEEPDDAALDELEAVYVPKVNRAGRPAKRQQVFVDILKAGVPRSVPGIVKLIRQEVSSLSPRQTSLAVTRWIDILIALDVVEETDGKFSLRVAL